MPARARNGAEPLRVEHMVPEPGRRAMQQRPEWLAIERRARAAIDAAVQPILPRERRLRLRPGYNQRTLF